MNKTLLVMTHEIRMTLRRKSFMIIGFGIPVVLGIIAVIVIAANRDGTATSAGEVFSGGSAEQTKEGYVDQGQLIKALPSVFPSDWLVEFPDEAAAQAALEAQEVDAYTIIPADYAETGNLTYVKPNYNPIGGFASTSGIEWILLANLLGDEALAASVHDPLRVRVTELAQGEEDPAENSVFVRLLPNLMALLMYMVIIMTASVLVAAVTDEKKNRVMEVLISSVSSDQLITGKILGLGVLGLMLLLTWVAVLWMVVTFGGPSLTIPVGFKLPADLLAWTCVYALMGYVMYGAQMAGLGALAPDIKDTRGAAFIILTPLIVVYMLLVVILGSPDGAIAVAASLFPLTSPVAMITRMVATEVPLWQGLLAAALQLLAAVLIIRAAARLFRAQTLLSGQSFDVKRYYAAFLGRG